MDQYPLIPCILDSFSRLTPPNPPTLKTNERSVLTLWIQNDIHDSITMSIEGM